MFKTMAANVAAGFVLTSFGFWTGWITRGRYTRRRSDGVRELVERNRSFVWDEAAQQYRVIRFKAQTTMGETPRSEGDVPVAVAPIIPRRAD